MSGNDDSKSWDENVCCILKQQYQYENMPVKCRFRPLEFAILMLDTGVSVTSNAFGLKAGPGPVSDMGVGYRVAIFSVGV